MRHHPPALLQVVHYISMRVFPDPPIRRFLAPQHHPTLLSNKGELIQDIFLDVPNAHSRAAPVCNCARWPHARAHTQTASTPPRSRHTPRRLRPFLSLARRVPPLARVSAVACEGCYCGRPDCELEGELRESLAKRRSDASELSLGASSRDHVRLPHSLDGPLVHFPIIAEPCGHKVRRRPIATQCSRAQRCSRL